MARSEKSKPRPWSLVTGPWSPSLCYNSHVQRAINLQGWFSASVWRVHTLVLMGYVVLAGVFAWPLPMHLADRVVLERGADFYQHIWNLWWVKFSLLTLHHDPYFTEYLHHPGGQSLVYHAVDALNGVASIPLQGVFGLLATFNLLRLTHLVFSSSAAYALCRALGLS